MNLHIKTWKRSIHCLSIRTKVMCFSTALVLFSTACIIASLYYNISGSYLKQILYSENQSFLQAEQFIEYKVRSVIYASAVVNYSNDIQSALAGSLEDTDEDNLQEQYRHMLTMEHVLSTVELQEYVHNAAIYVPGTLFYADNNMYFSNMDDIRHTSYYHTLSEDQVALVWLPPQDIPTPNEASPYTRMVSMLRAIRSTHDSSRLLGIQRVSILADDLDSILQKSNTTQQGVVFLSNSENELIACSNPVSYRDLASYQNKLDETMADFPDWGEIRINGKHFLLKSCAIPSTDWRLTAIIPYSEITHQSKQIGFLMLGLMGMIGIIACGCSYLFAESIAHRLRLLTGKMELVQGGDLSVRITPDYEDEIGYLFHAFNYMTQRLSILAKEQYNSGKAVKNAELRALQAQINPHFLYNTLDLINWEALDHNSPKISKLAQALAKFYRLSLSKGQDVVSLHDELEHVKTYIQIQNYRFDNRISLDIQVPDSLLCVPVIKLVLQPLVENSILHGRVGSADISGQILIKGTTGGNDMILTVEDNGIGMDEALLDGLLDSRTDHNGYGLYNIDQRFKLYYGEHYGLSFQSSPNRGMSVSIRFPGTSLQ